MSPDGPEISVVVPSRDRALRLRWLLNALQEQTLAPERFEVIICHDSHGPETDVLLHTHPLTMDGRLRQLTLPAGTLLAGAKRNLGWRLARAPLIAFTDDDCRPPEEWLARALAAARRHPGAIVQGATRPDPDELEIALRAPHARTQTVDPPSPWAETCNIVYPRELLQRLGGFAEDAPSFEDTDLALRAVEAGDSLCAAPEVLTFHAVHDGGLRGTVRTLARWESVPWALRRHPQLRRQCAAGLFWHETHGWLLLAFGGLALGPRRRSAALLLALPWAVRARPSYGSGVRALLRELFELPGQALVDLVELGVLIRASIRHRSLVL
ncbi:MAG: hypothetical protein DLM64_08810 [Solirubrobacterales bacterium]|nr:MAG: hypothetical protein DLM64_08810 [Solirubrobacterales bacterium]